MSDPAAPPVVSVVIPGYNGAAFIGETLQSLERQTLTGWEAIVVDDCSSDDTRDLVRAWPDRRVRLIENAVNGGPVRTRNRGVAAARGRFIAGLDQDDVRVRLACEKRQRSRLSRRASRCRARRRAGRPAPRR